MTPHPCFASHKIEVSHAACKDEFRWNPRSHSWRFFIFCTKFGKRQLWVRPFFLFYNNCYRKIIHNCSCAREQIMSSVSPLQQYPVGDSHNTNNDMLAADGSGDTLRRSQEKAPSRGMLYLVNITNIFFMLPQETHHHLLVRIHFETRTRREQKAPHAPMDLWLTCRRLARSF